MRRVYVNEYNGDAYESAEDCLKSEEEYKIEQEKAAAAAAKKAEYDARVDAAYDKAEEALNEYIRVLSEETPIDVDRVMLEMITNVLFRKDEDDD